MLFITFLKCTASTTTTTMTMRLLHQNDSFIRLIIIECLCVCVQLLDWNGLHDNNIRLIVTLFYYFFWAPNTKHTHQFTNIVCSVHSFLIIINSNNIECVYEISEKIAYFKKLCATWFWFLRKRSHSCIHIV